MLNNHPGKSKTTPRLAVLAAALLAGPAAAAASPAAGPRLTESFDFDWRFLKGDPKGAETPGFDDAGWRTVDLPHDFSVEGPVAKDNPSGERGGFLPLGTGWYRKSFTLPESFHDKRVLLRLDGVMFFSDVYLNGRHLGRESNPYLTRDWDLTDHLDPDGPNVVAVRADTPRRMERWYSGCGIYRHAWLMAVEPVRVREFGTAVTTPEITAAQATVRVRTTLLNQTGAPADVTLETVVLDPAGATVARTRSQLVLPARGTADADQRVQVAAPRLWSIEEPRLYTAVGRVTTAGRLTDESRTPFGIRTIGFDADHGFTLNGRKVVMRGVCLHQDIGALGAAVPDRAIERRLEVLRDIGVNAIRTSHNPYSIEFLDLCDRMGFVVIDECFDKWHAARPDGSRYPFRPGGEAWREPLRRFLERDRNHPSVVLWSVGNEVAQQLTPDGVEILKAMAAQVRRQEPTRPVTCALRPRLHDDGRLSGMIHHMDVVSLNYQSQLFDKLHREHPQMVLLGSETTPYYAMSMQWPPIQDPLKRWLPENPWLKLGGNVCGQFLWTGCEYLGEAVTGWPDIGWWCAPIDSCGRRKPYSWFIESLYGQQPLVHIAVHDPQAPVLGKYGWHFPPVFSHWNWEGHADTLEVHTFTNAHTVELTLNGKPLGSRRLADYPDHIIRWEVPNRPGTIRAVGRDASGAVVARHELRTAGPAARIQLAADRTTLAADGHDLAHLTVRVVDQAGTVVPHGAHTVEFILEGNGRLAAVDNANLQSHESFRGTRRTTYRGHALAIIRATRQPGTITLTATTNGLQPATLRLRSE